MSVLLDIVRGSARLQPETKKAYTRSIERFLEFAGADPARWSPIVVEQWRDQLMASGVKPQTANRHLYALRYACSRMAATGLGTDFAQPAESAKVLDRMRRSALSPDEVDAIMATMDAQGPRDIRDRLIFTLGIRQGLRVSSMATLGWSSISDRAMSFKAKGGSTYHNVLDDDSRAALDEWAAVVGDRGRVLRAIRVTLKGYSFGAGLSRQSIHKIVADRAAEAGVRRRIHPHLLRHTFITWLLDAGVPPHRIMTMTGHRSLDTLSKYVTDLNATQDPVASYIPKLRKK